jgi:hypothetical protein
MLPSIPGPGTDTCTACHAPPFFCLPGAEPLLVVDIMALGLDDVKISIYLNLAGVLKAVGDLLSGLLGGGHGSRPALPATVPHSYRPVCARRAPPGAVTGVRYSVADAEACLKRCEADAVALTVQLGQLRECLGVEVKRGLQVDNCLVVVGPRGSLPSGPGAVDDTCDFFYRA